MTDNQFQKVLNRLSKAHGKYYDLLNLAEAEFETRYGFHPSDRDCDSWIDTFHIVPSNPPTVLQVEQWAKDCTL